MTTTPDGYLSLRLQSDPGVGADTLESIDMPAEDPLAALHSLTAARGWRVTERAWIGPILCAVAVDAGDDAGV